MKRPDLDEAERRAMRTLIVLKNHFAVSDDWIGERMTPPKNHQNIQARRTGYVRIRAGEVQQYADAFEVPVELFRMETQEVLSWLAQHRPDVSIRQYGCMHVYAGHKHRTTAA